MTSWQDWTIRLGDGLTSWTLGASRDVTLLLVAGLTTAALLVVRRVFGDQAQLRRIAEDERRLRLLTSEARSRGDVDAARRHRDVRRLVAVQRPRAELLPGLVGLLLAWTIVSWGNRRLDRLPLNAGEPFNFSITLPATAVGSVVHVVPQSGLTAADGWIRQVELAADRSTPLGRADWRLEADSAGAVESLAVRHRDATYQHPIVVDGRIPPQEIERHDTDTTTRIGLTTYKPFGFIPGVAGLGVAPWLSGWLVLTLGGFLGAKRLLRLP